MPDFPGAGRAGAQHFLIGSDLYWVGGRNANGYLNEVWCFHFASNTWQQRSSLPIAGLWRGIGFSSNTKGYVSAGKISEDPLNGWNDSTWAYEPLSDSWHSEPAIDFGKRFYVGAAQQDSLLFVFGGVDPNGTVYSTLQKINLNNLQSELLPSFDGTARKGVMAFVNAGDFYITCGIEDQTRINTSYRVTQAVYTGIQDNVVYQLFPIPSYETIFIRVEPQYIGQWVEIKDQQGRTIDTHQLENTTESISMKDYPTGTYLVCLKGHARTVLKL
jgi:N-acetylneuraminic acid mutarotase